MLDKFKETAITWDKANRKIYESLRASAGDNKGRKLSVQLVNDGVIEDLSGASLSLFWETRDKTNKGLDAFTAVDATKGEFEIYYTTGMLSNEGTLNANLVLVDTSGRVVSEPFTITVFKGIDDEAVQSSDSFTALTEALIDINDLEQNYAPRLSTLEQNDVSLSQQLQQVVKKDIVKNYGAITTGTSYPLANKFGSLKEAQAKYPDANITSLSQELNWAIFNQAFYEADINRFSLEIPTGDYYIKEPLNPIGTSQANNSIENANLSIHGEGIGKTILIFDFTGDNTWAMDIAQYTAKVNIGCFTLKNKQQKQGCGLRINGLFSGNVYDILSIYFYIGADIKTYISEVKNVTAGYCSCGIIWRNGTSTSINNCYASNTIKRDINDNKDWSGVGHYILGYVYSTFMNLAADNCDQAYKISGTNTVRTKLLNCGMELGAGTYAIYVDNPNAYVSVDGFSIDGVGSIANIQNVGSIDFSNLADFLIHNIIRSANVSAGQVRINGRLLTTSNAGLMIGKTPTVNQGVKGVDDLAYDVINYAASNFLQNGRGVLKGNKKEFKIKLPNNGGALGIKIDVIPYIFYGNANSEFRAGSVFITAFNSGGTANLFYKSTDANISVVITKVDAITATVLIDPFATSTQPTAHSAIFDVCVYYNSSSTDKNIKSNREDLKIGGVDY